MLSMVGITGLNLIENKKSSLETESFFVFYKKICYNIYIEKIKKEREKSHDKEEKEIF
jgi:hypothetical protein